jgi:hypothetical protein
VAGPAAVAVLAAGAGVGLALYFGGGGPQAVASSPPAASPGAGAPGQGGSAVTRLFIAGRITAVSGRSITIGTGASSVTAAITGATKVSGKVHSAAALAVGDSVSAQITEANGTATATAIQDPPGQEPPLSGTP